MGSCDGLTPNFEGVVGFRFVVQGYGPNVTGKIIDQVHAVQLPHTRCGGHWATQIHIHSTQPFFGYIPFSLLQNQCFGLFSEGTVIAFGRTEWQVNFHTFRDFCFSHVNDQPDVAVTEMVVPCFKVRNDLCWVKSWVEHGGGGFGVLNHLCLCGQHVEPFAGR